MVPACRHHAILNSRSSIFLAVARIATPSNLFGVLSRLVVLRTPKRLEEETTPPPLARLRS